MKNLYKLLIIGLLFGCNKDEKPKKDNQEDKKETISVIFTKENNIDKLAQIKIKFDKSIKTNQGKEVDNDYCRLKIVKLKKGEIDIDFIATISSDKKTIDIVPKQKLNYGSTYKIYLNEANVSYNLNPKEYSFSTEKETKKETISVIFTKEDNIDKLAQIKIKFDKSIKTNQGKEVDNDYCRLKIVKLKKGEIDIDFIATISSDKKTIDIVPKQKLNYGSTYKIYLNEANVSYNLNPKEYSFRTGDKSINEKLKSGNPWLIKKLIYNIEYKSGKTDKLDLLISKCILDNTWVFSDNKYTLNEGNFICEGSQNQKDFSYQITSNNKFKDVDGEWDINELNENDFKISLSRGVKGSDINFLTNLVILGKMKNNEIPSSDDIDKIKLTFLNTIKKITVTVEYKSKETPTSVQPDYYFIEKFITTKTPSKPSEERAWDYNFITGSKSGADIYFKIYQGDKLLYTYKDDKGNEIYRIDVDPDKEYEYPIKPYGLFIKRGVEYKIKLYDYDKTSADDLMGIWTFTINSVDVSKKEISFVSTSGNFKFSFVVKYF